MNNMDLTWSDAEKEAAEYAGTQEAMDAARQRAEFDGFEIILGTPYTLLLDFDEGAQLNGQMLLKLGEHLRVVRQQTWASRSGTGHHVVITLDDSVSPAHALALEAALGSDPLRAILGVVRLRNGVEQPRMLFKPTARTKAVAEGQF